MIFRVFFLNSSYILDISLLSDVELLKVFSVSVSCVFFSVLCPEETFQFLEVLFMNCFVSAWVTGVPFTELLPVSMCPHYSSIRFSVPRFMLRSLIHLGLSFVQDDRYGSVWFPLHTDIQLGQHNFVKMLSFYHCMSLDSSSKIRCL